MGYKSVCLTCRISFSNGTDFTIPALQKCPQCSGEMFIVHQKFKPPKKTDLKAWKIVAFLIEKGFRFYSSYDGTSFLKVNYPKTMNEAQEFVKNHVNKE